MLNRIELLECDETELPKVVTPRRRTLTPEECGRVIDVVPAGQYRLMVETAIETGLRWGSSSRCVPDTSTSPRATPAAP